MMTVHRVGSVNATVDLPKLGSSAKPAQPWSPQFAFLAQIWHLREIPCSRPESKPGPPAPRQTSCPIG